MKSAHSNARDYQCSHPGCGSSFVTASKLKTHEATHVDPKKYICRDHPPCNQVFRKKETLARHVLSVHENKKPFPCTHVNSMTGNVCSQAFDTNQKLLQHVRQMHDPTRFSCSDCVAHNARIEANPYLNEQQKATSTKQAYFSTYAELQFHNANEHPPTCSLCSVPFNTPRELTRHNELVHGIVNPNSTKASVTCTWPGCGRTFSKQGNLNVHIKTAHENRRDFACGITKIELVDNQDFDGCQRTFTSKSALVDHIRAIHLGVESTQAKKRRLQNEADGPKSKKPRSDKGVRRQPAITDAASNINRYPFEEVDLDTEPDWQSDLGDEQEELDGNTTMVGSMLYDPNGAYHYSSGQRTPIEPATGGEHDDLPLFDYPQLPAEPEVEDFILHGYTPAQFGKDNEHGPLFRNAFDMEPEMSDALDPDFFNPKPSGHHSGFHSGF
jgi:hypothetical protein